MREAVGADAGVVEQQVDPPEALDRGVDGGVQVTMSATVEGEGGEKPVCVAELIFRYVG